MRPLGWRYESARHALARRGIKTVQQLPGRLRIGSVPIVVKPLRAGEAYPVNPRDVARQLQRMPQKEVKSLKGVEFVPPKDKEEAQSWARYVRSKRLVRVFSQKMGKDGELGGEEPDVAVDHMKTYVLPHELGHHTALTVRNITDEHLSMAEARADAAAAGMDVEDRDAAEFKKYHTDRDEGYAAKKESEVSAYWHYNLDGHPAEDFWKSTKEMFAHPVKDWDEEWESYEAAKGVPVVLAPDGTAERWTERGAALFGRVVTQANVEPLVDPREPYRPMRETMIDILFGRRAQAGVSTERLRYDARRVSRVRLAGMRELRKRFPHAEHDKVKVGSEVEVVVKRMKGRDLITPEKVRVRVTRMRGKRLVGDVVSLPRFAELVPGQKVSFTLSNVVGAVSSAGGKV